jgi:hypothetical protein
MPFLDLRSLRTLRRAFSSSCSPSRPYTQLHSTRSAPRITSASRCTSPDAASSSTWRVGKE